jgi:hypothetical protein
MNVKLIRMWSGEDVIADLVGDLTDNIVIRNPIVAIPTGNGQMGFAPWSPLLKEKGVDIEVTKKYVVYISEAQEQIVEQYEQMFSVIQKPSKKLIVSQ